MTDILTLAQLGIHTEQFTPLRANPSIVVYSGAGCGKSSQLAEALQTVLFLKSSRTVTRPYYSMLRWKAIEAYARAWCNFAIANSAHVNHPAFKDMADQAGLDAAGAVLGLKSKLAEQTIPTNMHNWSYLDQVSATLVNAIRQGYKAPVTGVVLDEGTDFLRRVYTEMEQSGKFKAKKSQNTNDWAVQDAAEAWLTNYTNLFRDSGLTLGFACQEAAPVYFENSTKVKFKGGPETVFGRLRETICRAPDIVLRITLENQNASATGGLPPPPGLPGLPPLPGAAPAPSPPARPGAPSAPSAPAPTIASALAAPPAEESPIVSPTRQELLELFGRLPSGLTPPVLEDTPPDRWAIRRYWTEVHPEWNTKFRDFTVSYREPLGLRRLLERAGYL